MPRPTTVVRLVRNSRNESTVLAGRFEVEHAVADERNQQRRHDEQRHRQRLVLLVESLGARGGDGGASAAAHA